MCQRAGLTRATTVVASFVRIAPSKTPLLELNLRRVPIARRRSGSNIGGSGVLGHSGYLSLARELSLNDDTLATTFIPELIKLRIPTSHQTLASGGERVGDTLLLAGQGSAQMEVRLMIAAHASPFASTDGFGIAVKSQAAASGAYLLESTRIGVSPNLRTLFIDRSYANASGIGWPQTGASDKRVADQPVMSYPLEISAGEAVEIVVIVDGGIVEVCANNRSVVAALALSGNSTRVGVFGLPSTATVHAEAWELTPLYPSAQ
jgi:sucrose-6-phosphate hydrolase SacC (GH32 family)